MLTFVTFVNRGITPYPVCSAALASTLYSGGILKPDNILPHGMQIVLYTI